VKHLKAFESYEDEFNIDLVTLCEHIGNMYDVVIILELLQKSCKDYFFTSNGLKYKREISHYRFNGKDMIYFNGTAMGYDYVMNDKNKNNLFFTFYGVEVINDLLVLSNTKKYNL